MNMKKIKLVKKNFYLAIFVLLLLVGFVVAQYDPSKASHGILYTDRVEPKSLTDGTIEWDANLDVLGNLFVNGELLGMGYWNLTVAGGDIFYNDGNVGIGTDEPLAMLDVVGDIMSNGVLVCLADGTNCQAAGKWDGNKPGDIYYNDGNVQIGGPTLLPPSEKLVVVGNIKAININATGIICDSTGCIGAGLGADTDWIESEGNVYRETGNVGIGTTTPGARLDIIGSSNEGVLFQINNTAEAGIGDPVFRVYNNWKGSIGLEIEGTGAIKQFDLNTGETLNLFNTGGDSFIMGGNVGIGTTEPTEKLEVDGNIKTNGNINATGTVCDGNGNCIGGGGFGEWQTDDSGQIGGTGAALRKGKVYQAATDGFVVLYANPNRYDIIAYTDDKNPPTTIKARSKHTNVGTWGSITMPVKKGDYWKVEAGDVESLYWIPLEGGGGSGASLPTCSNGQILKYNEEESKWECGFGGGGGGATYDSGWFACTTGGTYDLDHNLGTKNIFVQVFFAPDSGGSPVESKTQIVYLSRSEVHEEGAGVQDITDTRLTVQAGQSQVAMRLGSDGNRDMYRSGHYRVIATTGSGGGSVVAGEDNCVVVESGVGAQGYYEINLIKNGKNICLEPHGCEMLMYKRSDPNGKLADMDGESHYRYIQDENGNFRELLGAETGGVNGDGTDKHLRDWGGCDIWDDRSDEGLTPSKDTLVLRDHDADEQCVVSVCGRKPAEGSGVSGTPPLEFEVYNPDTSTYACVQKELEEYCGDRDGCTIRILMQHETRGDDLVHIIDEHIYMEQTDLSNNNDAGISGYARQSGGGDDGAWVSGTRDTMFSPWDWVWAHNYKHDWCKGQSGHGPAFEDPYTFNFMSHPNVRANFIVYDSFSGG